MWADHLYIINNDANWIGILLKNTIGNDASSIKRWASSTDQDNTRSFDECNSINDASFILEMIINTKENPFKKKNRFNVQHLFLRNIERKFSWSSQQEI